MEEHLIEEARGGNRHSLAKLLYENYEMVFRYLIKFTLNKSMAEDLVQETMVRAIEKFEMFDPSRAKFSTWLIAIAQNIYLDGIRKRKREKKHINDDLQLEDLYDLQEDHDEDWDRVLDSLSRLSEESRIPLVMKHYHGYSLEEIARLMSIPLGTVKSRIHNAIKVIRKELEQNA
jgi:RNA polymerase sigma-70 factor (ECF subfamily)